MLPKANRLKKENDFKAVFGGGRFVRGVFFDLKFICSKTDICRFGFVVSLKVSKKAVERNRAKRLLSDAAQMQTQFIRAGHDFVIIAKPKIVGAKSNEISVDFKNVIKKAGLSA